MTDKRRLQFWKIFRLMLIFTFAYILLWNTVFDYRSAHPHSYGQGDFAVFYSATELLVANENPYHIRKINKALKKNRNFEAAENFLYPPTAALFFLPTQLVSQQKASKVWLSINIGFFFVLLVAVQYYISRRFVFWEGILLLTAFSFFGPLFTNLRLGQVNLFLTILLFGFCIFLKRYPRFASALLAIAISIKVFPAILVGYLALRRQWMIIIWVVVWSLVLSMVAISFFGIEPFQLYGERFFAIANEGIGHGAKALSRYDNASLNGFLYRLVFFLTGQEYAVLREYSGHIAIIRAIILVPTFTLVVYYSFKTHWPEYYGIFLWLSFLLFASTEIHTQYMLFLAPFTMIMLIQKPKNSFQKGMRWLAPSIILLWSFSYMRLLPEWYKASTFSVLSFAFVGNLVILMWLLLYARRMINNKE